MGNKEEFSKTSKNLKRKQITNRSGHAIKHHQPSKDIPATLGTPRKRRKRLYYDYQHIWNELQDKLREHRNTLEIRIQVC